MGTKVQSKSYFSGYNSMKDLNDDSNSCSWPFYFGDNKTLTNGSYYNGYLPQTIAPGLDKDVVKRTMLQHEAIFKSQVSELHRLYRTQRELMDEIKRKEVHQNRMLIEASFSSQKTTEDSRRWHIPSFSGSNSRCATQFSAVTTLPSQNGNGIEVLASRPEKVRRKLIDLQLPADEYIDDNDEPEQKTISFLNGNTKLASENGCQKDFLRTESFRSTNNLADLNEPILIEDDKASIFSDSLSRESCHGNVQRHEPSGHPKSGLFELPNSYQESNNGSVNNQRLENGRGWFAHVLESGKNKNNPKSVLQCIPQETPAVFSQSSNILSAKPRESSFLTGQSKIDMLGERKNRGFDISEGSHPGSVVASNIPNRYPVPSPSDLTKSWSPNSVSSWEKLSSSLNQYSISARMHPSSAQSQGILGDRWHLNNGDVRLKPSNESESSNHNGFFHLSSSGSKELPICIPSAHYEYLNCNNNRNLISEQFSNHSSARVDSKDSNCTNLKFMKDMNLNVEVSECGQKHQDPVAVFPWLKTQSSCSNKANGQNEKSVSCFGKAETNDCSSSRKILGVPNLYKPHGTVQSEELKNKGKIRLLDINLPCEQTEGCDVDLEKGISKKETGFRHQIDLNMCVSEYEASSFSSVPSMSVKINKGFDLEAPVVLESDEDVPRREEPAEDFTCNAAEALISISLNNLDNAPEESGMDQLRWFAEIVSCCGEELENKYEVIARESPSEEIDYFEYMTLKQTEMTEEEYMPKPLVPEHINLDDETTVGPTKAQLRPTRKGQGRRGRQQRRDFQRDILPGLTSLARLEVTEDMQTFGSLMEATGHAWSRRSSTRNGSARGRRRAVATTPSPAVTPIPPPPNNNIEVTLEDRNLTGWGKTTRRPRRQRCPPAVAVPLT